MLFFFGTCFRGSVGECLSVGKCALGLGRSQCGGRFCLDSGSLFPSPSPAWVPFFHSRECGGGARVSCFLLAFLVQLVMVEVVQFVEAELGLVASWLNGVRVRGENEVCRRLSSVR